MTDALSLTNSVGADQQLTADEVSNGLRTFNDLLEIFSVNDLAVWGKVDDTFALVSNQDTYTIGTGGNFNIVRPVRVYDPVYTVLNGVTFVATSMTQAEYNTLAFKSQTGQFPVRYLFINDFPLARIQFWPIPTQVLPVTITSDRVLASVASAGTTLTFPPGYAMVFKYKLAVMLAPMFGKNVMREYPDVVAIATSSFADIQRANKKQLVMTYDLALQQNTYGINSWLGGY